MTVTRGDHDFRIEPPWSLDERSGAVLLLLLVPAILVLDYTAGRDFSLHLFYLVPTGLAAWSFGSRVGYAVGLMAAVYWAFVGFATRQPHAPVASLVWDVASTLALFLFVAFVIGRHRAFVDRLLETARLDLASGALSSREFNRLLATEVRRAKRYRRPLALAVFDLERKEMARKGTGFVAAAVRAVGRGVRDSDSIGRLSEERIAILLVECRAPEAMAAGARVRESASESLGIAAPALGVASYGGKSLMSDADFMKMALDQLEIARRGKGQSEDHVD